MDWRVAAGLAAVLGALWLVAGVLLAWLDAALAGIGIGDDGWGQ
jgi:hypothetical protein